METTIQARLRRHTHEMIKDDPIASSMSVPDLLSATYELWLRSTLEDRTKAMKASSRRHARVLAAINKS